MTVEHITNCINLLRRAEEHRLARMNAMANTFSGASAIDSVEDAICAAEEDGFEDINEYIESFEEELRRRHEEFSRAMRKFSRRFDHE